MKGKHLHFAAGLMIGAALFGGGTALAVGILAEPSSQIFYLRDQKVHLEAYYINGYNYVKLRDVGQVSGFNVSYDVARNAAIINPDEPYTADDAAKVTTAPAAISQEDYSQRANPAIFKADLTREVYNVVRQTIVSRDDLLAGGGKGTVRVEDIEGRRFLMDAVTSVLGNYPVYEISVPEAGKLTCNVKYPGAYAEAVAHTQPLFDRLSGMGEAERVETIAWYVCDRLTYHADVLASPRNVLASDEPVPGNCMSYAHSFLFLCNRAGIPCILLHSETHQWNRVYVDGQWWSVDLSANDVGDAVELRPYSNVLHHHGDMQGSAYINSQPEITDFAMEILVPSSTI